MADWSGLTNDMLHHVESFLPLPDQHRFSAVCHDWRLVAKQKKHHRPAPQLPWLVLGEDPTTKKRNFFNLSEQRHYSIDIPELYGQYVCGSSFGWLVTVDSRINGRLLNPFSREYYELPPFPPYSTRSNIILTEGPVFAPCGMKIGYTFKDMQTRIVVRAVLSHDPRERSDFTLMILFGECYKLAFWRPGDTSWTMVRYPPQTLVALMDIICFEGKFYAVSCDELFAVDVVYDEPKIIRIKPRILSNLKRVAIAAYLVDYKGKLLLVLRFKDFWSREKKFRILSLDLKKETCNELDDIDDLALFVGNNSALVVNPSKISGCVGKTIYFTDLGESYYWLEKGHDFGVYNVVTKTTGRFSPAGDEAFDPPNAALTWLAPNP
ncbi:hypothetical protein LUZ60_007496 [Juncus effusus]|nr:hypothetical protein LUZ60_007496 [Juncus effusus]